MKAYLNFGVIMGATIAIGLVLVRSRKNDARLGSKNEVNELDDYKKKVGNIIKEETPKVGIQLIISELWNFVKNYLAKLDSKSVRLGIVSFILPFINLLTQLSFTHVLLILILLLQVISLFEKRIKD